MTVSVNAVDWNALSADDRKAIEGIIADNFKGETIEPDAGASVAITNSSDCISTCSTIEAAAIQACQRLPFPGSLVCTIIANKAGELCRSRC